MKLKLIFSLILLMLMCDGVYQIFASEVIYTQANGASQIFKVDVNNGIRTQLTHTAGDFGGDWFDPAFALPVSPQPDLLTTTWGQLKKENPDGRK